MPQKMPPKSRGKPAPTALDMASVTEKLRTCDYLGGSEEDLRVNMEMIIRDALPGLPTPKYETSIRTSTFNGRADAVHQMLVIEYEKPGSMQRPANVRHAVRQVCDYLHAIRLERGSEQDGASAPKELTQEEEERLSGGVGIATDGDRFVFVQRRGREWVEDARGLDEGTVEKLLLWLRSTGRRDLSPSNLIADFGPSTELATNIVKVLAELVQSRAHPKANVIYEEWRRIFGIVYGTDQLHRTRRDPEAQSLSAAYRLSIGVDFSILLFAVQTYYALLMKLLATEVIVAQGGISDSFLGSLTRRGIRNQLRSLESGEILQQYNIRNAIEEDFFGWYPDSWVPALEDNLWQLVKALCAYDIGTFDLKPERARDLLKDLYHGLIPETVRHALGEYYTPDWLAEHTLTLAGYDGDPHKTILDPACGSGTFLVFAVQRIRQWLADHSIEWGSNEQRRVAIDLIRRNVVGFDLNPLAVIASRTNYLFALGPLLRHRSPGADFEIPVYLTDSVLLPGRMDEQRDLFAEDTMPFPMTVGTFNLPRLVVENRQVPDLMNLLHDAIAESHSRESFVGTAIRQLTLPSSGPLRAALESLFNAMKDLDRQGKNRVWAKLIRNRYAAMLFRHYFDFVVGNPPHVNWESLTPEWCKTAEDEYRRYGLFTLKGLDSRHGGGKKDIAALFTYAVVDHFLKDRGVLALVVHVSLFKTSGAGEGYRRFQLGNGEPFAVRAAHDFKSFQPFQTHSHIKIKTRTVSFSAIKGDTTRYPVPYTTWFKTVKGHIPGELSWREAEQRLRSEELIAVPLRGTSKEGRLSPWLTVSKADLPRCRRVISPDHYEPHYHGREGVNTGGLNGAYFVEVLERNPNGTVLIRNLYDVGKIACPKVKATIEMDLLFPLLRGRGVARWQFNAQDHILVVQDPKTQRGYPENWLQQKYPLTWSYLKKFEKLLRARKAFIKFFDPAKDAFYSMYSVGTDTFAPFKVAWMDISADMKAVVIEPTPDGKMVTPEHTVIFVPATSADEAHFLAAVLNSAIVNTVVSGYAVDNHLSTHPIENIVIPKYDKTDRNHARLVALSRQAHDAAFKEDRKQLEAIEDSIDEGADLLW
jgi:SAM-dependent methyltransferase